MDTHDEWGARDRQAAVDVNAYLKDMDSFARQFIGRMGLIASGSAEHIDETVFSSMLDELVAQVNDASERYYRRKAMVAEITTKAAGEAA